MMLEVTRDVISDLWPVYRSGEAKAETRHLVDAFLREDASFASVLRASEGAGSGAGSLRLSPDAERRLLDEAGRRARGKLWLIAGAVGLGGLILLVALGGLLLQLFLR
jgi:hypothetical protein